MEVDIKNMQCNLLELFILYNTVTEQYYGRSKLADPNNLSVGIWTDNIEKIFPWSINEIKTLCVIPFYRLSRDCEKNTIVVPIDQNGYDFTESTPLTHWCN